MQAQGEPVQPVCVTHKHRDVVTLLLPGECYQPSDVVGFGDLLLLDLNDDISCDESRL